MNKRRFRRNRWFRLYHNYMIVKLHDAWYLALRDTGTAVQVISSYHYTQYSDGEDKSEFARRT